MKMLNLKIKFLLVKKIPKKLTLYRFKMCNLKQDLEPTAKYDTDPGKNPSGSTTLLGNQHFRPITTVSLTYDATSFILAQKQNKICRSTLPPPRKSIGRVSSKARVTS
jgi:hypothetical protein